MLSTCNYNLIHAIFFRPDYGVMLRTTCRLKSSNFLANWYSILSITLQLSTYIFLSLKYDEVSYIFKVIDVFLFVPTDVFVRIDFMIIGTTPSHTSTTASSNSHTCIGKFARLLEILLLHTLWKVWRINFAQILK